MMLDVAIRQNMGYGEALVFRRNEAVSLARLAWSDWFYLVELHPFPLEVRCHSQHYRIPITNADRAATDWFAFPYSWAEEPKQWFEIGPRGDVPVEHIGVE